MLNVCAPHQDEFARFGRSHDHDGIEKKQQEAVAGEEVRAEAKRPQVCASSTYALRSLSNCMRALRRSLRLHTKMHLPLLLMLDFLSPALRPMSRNTDLVAASLCPHSVLLFLVLLNNELAPLDRFLTTIPSQAHTATASGPLHRRDKAAPMLILMLTKTPIECSTSLPRPRLFEVLWNMTIQNNVSASGRWQSVSTSGATVISMRLHGIPCDGSRSPPELASTKTGPRWTWHGLRVPTADINILTATERPPEALRKVRRSRLLPRVCARRALCHTWRTRRGPP